ncbi:MAG: hypothetical protein GX643_05120 [Acidimicrobiales bacterium]|nr:hypothetical protein [Acidimicrobiales bacterium]
MTTFGCFPFGQPNTVRPARLPRFGPARVMIVGVYPSAWHVSWKAPAYLASRSSGGSVAALAVDVEPEVFWNGDTDSFSPMLNQWRAVTGFVDGDHAGAHGWIGPRSPSANGSSGAKVEERYLRPLGIPVSQTAFTDVYPVFVVKRSKSGKRREQGDAIAVEYDSIAQDIGRQPSTLPPRPSTGALVAGAIERFSDRIVDDLEAADAPLIISLGDEALQVLSQIPALQPRPPARTITETYGTEYGRPGSLTVNGTAVQWIALAHPGLLKGKPRPVPISPAKRSGPGWNWVHEQWAREARPDVSGNRS